MQMTQRTEQLPDELIQSTGASRLAFLLAATLAIIIGLNAVVAASGVFSRLDFGGRLIRDKWNLLENLEEPVDWVILGDSSVNQGIVPDQLVSQLGGTAINLGSAGDMLLVNDVWMLEEYIERYGTPRGVIIAHVYDIWPREATPAAFANTPVWDGHEPPLSLGAKDTFDLIWHRYVPLYQSSHLFKRLLQHPDWISNPPIQIQDDGFAPLYGSKPAEIEADLQWHVARLPNRAHSVSEQNQQAVNRLVELAETNDFNVYIANSPIYEGLKNNSDFQTYFEGVSNFLNELDESSPNIHYVLQDTPSFASEVMQNVDHLTFEGAESFTRQLAESISKRLDQ